MSESRICRIGRNARDTRVGSSSGGTPPPASAAHWTFDSVLTDSSGNGKSLAGTATYGVAKFSTGVNGTTGALSRTQNMLTGGVTTGTWSLSFWTKFGATNDSHGITLLFQDSVGGIQFRMQQANNDLDCTSDIPEIAENIVGGFLSSGIMNHVVLSVSGGSMRFFVNGTNVLTVSGLVDATAFDAAGTFSVTVAPDTGGALIDDLVLVQAALTQANVNYLWALSAGRVYP